MSKEQGLLERAVIALEIIAQAANGLNHDKLVAEHVAGKAAVSATLVADAAEKPAKAPKPKAKPDPVAEKPKDEPKPDYEPLRAAIVALAAAGPEGRESVIRIMTEHGLDRTQKVADADPAQWDAMKSKAEVALAALNDSADFT